MPKDTWIYQNKVQIADGGVSVEDQHFKGLSSVSHFGWMFCWIYLTKEKEFVRL